MFERLKRNLVDSYVGAIAMGWLLATAVLDFVGIFSLPVRFWVSANEYRTPSPGTGPVSFHPQDAVPELVKTILVLLIWYVLFRWLYFKPVKVSASEPTLDLPSKD
jgi:hypothetical protein